MTNLPKQNEISHAFTRAKSLADREKKILQDITQNTGFIPERLVNRSSWWGSSKVGAVHYRGTYQGKNVILKIQGVKPNISEATMIQSFVKNNHSLIIRPPHLYQHLAWNSDQEYEALIMEDIPSSPLITLPTTLSQVDNFFEIYHEYRQNCRQQPWVKKPSQSISDSIKDNFVRWRESSLKIYPTHPFRQKEDFQLIDQAVQILSREYQHIDYEFVHGHFSYTDLYQSGRQIILLSNLYWSWRPPGYDTVFAYHWFMYHLPQVSDITPAQIESQRQLWLSHINSFSTSKKLLNLALLERAAAGLNLDALSIDPKIKISQYLVDSTRDNLKQLLQQFS